MTLAESTAVVGAAACTAGFVGALTGLGGGVVLVPVLTLLLGVDLRHAVGASLVGVIATSSGAAAAYVRDGWSNLRIGMFLEVATTAGALVGAGVAGWLEPSAVSVIFGVVLLWSAASARHVAPDAAPGPPGALAARLRLDGKYPSQGAS